MKKYCTHFSFNSGGDIQLDFIVLSNKNFRHSLEYKESYNKLHANNQFFYMPSKQPENFGNLFLDN